MKSPTTYIYGKNTGHIYWTGNDSLYSVYRYAIGVDDYKPSYAGDLSWVDEAGEMFLCEKTRFGYVGFKFACLRRHIRNYDVLMEVLRWFVLLSGAASLICAVTVLSFPFSAIAGIYGLIVAMMIARNL